MLFTVSNHLIETALNDFLCGSFCFQADIKVLLLHMSVQEVCVP
jgi:hypothetical protein